MYSNTLNKNINPNVNKSYLIHLINQLDQFDQIDQIDDIFQIVKNNISVHNISFLWNKTIMLNNKKLNDIFFNFLIEQIEQIERNNSFLSEIIMYLCFESVEFLIKNSRNILFDSQKFKIIDIWSQTHNLLQSQSLLAHIDLTKVGTTNLVLRVMNKNLIEPKLCIQIIEKSYSNPKVPKIGVGLKGKKYIGYRSFKPETDYITLSYITNTYYGFIALDNIENPYIYSPVSHVLVATDNNLWNIQENMLRVSLAKRGDICKIMDSMKKNIKKYKNNINVFYPRLTIHKFEEIENIFSKDFGIETIQEYEIQNLKNINYSFFVKK